MTICRTLARNTLATASAVMMLAGCAGTTAPPISQAEISAGLAGYRIGAGDKLRITVFNEPTLTGEYNVSPSGMVAFPLIGMIEGGERSITEVTQAITGKLAQGYVNDPHVSVEVLNYRPFYILGEVNHPGEYAYASGITVEQAVARAGGFTYRANEKSVFLRRQQSGERTVDLREMQVAVMPGDTIRVGQRYF